MKICGSLFILCQLFLFGCGMLHKTTKNSSIAILKDKEETKINDQSAHRHEQETRSLIIKSDSLDASSLIEIWPKGKFELSPEYVFSGQAEKVLIPLVFLWYRLKH